MFDLIIFNIENVISLNITEPDITLNITESTFFSSTRDLPTNARFNRQWRQTQVYGVSFFNTCVKSALMKPVISLVNRTF